LTGVALAVLLLGVAAGGRRAAAAETSEPRELGLQDAVLSALENNHAFRVARYNPLIKRTLEDGERAAFDPVISADVSRGQSAAAQPASTNPTLESVTTDTSSGSVGLSLKTALGGSIALTGEGQVVDPYANGRPLAQARVGLSVTQSLLNGAGAGAALASLREARLDTRLSEFELRAAAEALIARVEETYWDVALATSKVAIYRRTLELARAHEAEIGERIRAGASPEIDRVAAQAETAARQDDLLRAENAGAVQRLQLLRLINPPGSNAWGRELTLTSRPDAAEPLPDDVAAHVALALRLRNDLNQARLTVERGELEVVRTKNGLLPKLDLFVTLGRSGYAESFSGALQAEDADGYDLQAGLKLEYPVLNRAAQAARKRAVLTQAQAAEALANLVQLAEVDVRAAYLQVGNARAEILTAQSARRLQEEKWKAESEKYRLGNSTELQVAQVQRDVLQSRVNEVQSVIAYCKNLVALYRADGSLMARHRIAVNRPAAP
jgi:outer membrane protein TolC